MGLALVRTHLKRYFEHFDEKVEIVHFACQFPPKAKRTESLRDINWQSGRSQLFHQCFENKVRNVFLQWLSPCKTDLECLNQFLEHLQPFFLYIMESAR